MMVSKCHFEMKKKKYINVLEQQVASFFFKGPDNTLGFASHLVSVATTQLSCCSLKVAIDN